jgi:CPA1 family monovalent cation:H+ antiporter
MLRPSVGSGLVISWAGMRGIVTLAAALALPEDFPYRGLIVLTAFSVVVATLVIQGLTLKPLMRALDLHDGDPVGAEVAAARERALRAALGSLEREQSPVAELLRKELKALLTNEHSDAPGAAWRASHGEMRRGALRAARQAVLAMRSSEEIGDDAFHRLEEEIDWLEMAGGND